jgi:hypothetical protein
MFGARRGKTDLGEASVETLIGDGKMTEPHLKVCCVAMIQ